MYTKSFWECLKSRDKEKEVSSVIERITRDPFHNSHLLGVKRIKSNRAIDLQGAHLLLNHTAEIVVTGVSQHKWVDRFHYYVAARMVAPDVSGMDFLGAVSGLDLFPYMVIPAHENRLFY